MNTNKLEKHYGNLTVHERARLMIAARMRNDDSDLKNLVASAQQKSYLIRANDESEICEAWHKAHDVMIALNADLRIAELNAALACSITLVDNEIEDEKLDKLFALKAVFLVQRKIAILAFQDWLEEHELSMEKELLEAFGVQTEILSHDTNKSNYREMDLYKDILNTFERILTRK